MASPDLRLACPDFATHLDGLAELMVLVFFDDHPEERLADVRERLQEPNWGDRGCTRIGMLADRIVTHFGVARYETRVGRSVLVTAGVGGVATHPEHRGQGLMRVTAAASIATLREAGYDISLLFGIPDFYEKFGYVRAWSDDIYTVKAEDLEPGLPPPEVEVFSPPTLPEDVVECGNRCRQML